MEQAFGRWFADGLYQGLVSSATQAIHLKLTNLEVRHLIQVTESLIFTNLEISIFCAVQETSRHVINKLQVQNVFVFSSLYYPFYCSVLNNNSSSHVQSLTAYFVSVFECLVPLLNKLIPAHLP